MNKKVNFTAFCPHCGKNLRGEKVTNVSMPTDWRTFFYTESDHQLAYDGVRLVNISCLEMNERA